MPVYRGRAKGTWRIVVWTNNRSHERIFRGTKAAAKQFEAALRLELGAESAAAGSPGPKLLALLMGPYAKAARDELSDSTWRKVRRYQVGTLGERLGHLYLSDLQTADIEAYKRARMADEVKASTINNELRLLRTVLNWAARNGYKQFVPDVEVRRLKQTSRRVHCWSADEVDRLYEATRERYPHLLPMFVFLANTGCRKGEAIAAQWSWVDQDADMVRIPATDVWQPKDGEARDIPMGTALRAIFAGERRSERWLFPRLDGKRYTEFPKDLWWRITDAAGLDGGPHTLRHTFASHFLAARPDLFLLAQVLGHSHERVTQLYTHLLPEHLARARDAVQLMPRTKTMARAMAAHAKKQRNAR